MKPPPGALPYLVLLGGVLVASTAAIMITQAIRLGVPPLTIAAGRLLLASAILSPIAWLRSGSEIRRIGRKDWLWALGAGVCLALHFATWISSLAYTSVASSTVLVATNPVFVALASWLVLREPLPAGTWIGVLLTLLGSACVGLSDHGAGGGSHPLLGDGLALAGAASVSGYFLMGRRLRVRLPLLPYIWIVYGSAALVLALWAGLAGQTLLGLPPLAYLLMLGLAIGPQLLGHTAFNWAIRYLSATLVTIAILGEPIGSALMAMALFHQPLHPLQLLGGAILLAGIATAVLAEGRTRRRALRAAKPEGGNPS